MKIICIGRNYAEHAKELGNEIPDEPVIFMKPKSALLQPHTPFYYPEFTNELNYECELVLRVCKNGKYINERNASNYYNGITVGIDFTARDLQNIAKEKGLPWEKAKAFDNSAAIGKFLDLTPDQKKANFTFKLLVNNQEMQRGNSADMVFKFDNLVAQISNYFSLNIGDIIFTGTPAGVGECVVGDELEAFLGNQSLLKLDIK
ncbi:MAG: fumarylacetoacetate hydrolase family protein [Chitinophagaceae bacterium]|jgi:2-keto-4-pentenoate hydratase/2-oxohepta-3-ene-1,7-dioic acid hydratase in catechol pathway|nr:fumarylacetoacetate hydrolase family protein [Chitinophagaceae bacterium]MBP6046555.1 fumarylacetoacetate hydrolase family protein [Ferruginibacter sp.]NMD28113.1 fumarylacetoacetate hydrolase family protein [Bacteroidota bacterium]MBK7089779.1 fumarylacetoacetate hydrolase family protein [Chitinophagaceae bacterium]MBK7347508.1 fumarylacetoacetate hydrolase family protein [Chitinophagaceae bacterium]